MAWGDPTSLKFDIEEIASMREKLQDTSADLSEFKTKLLNEIDELKKKWQTPAGKKFTENVNTDWAVQVDKYIKIIDAVDELLNVAQTNYKSVAEKANTISF